MTEETEKETEKNEEESSEEEKSTDTEKESDSTEDSTENEEKNKEEEDLVEDQEVNLTGGLDSIGNIPMNVSVVLGRTVMSVGNLKKMGRGAVIKLDKKVGDMVDLVINGRVIAQGKLTKENDNLAIVVKSVGEGK